MNSLNYSNAVLPVYIGERTKKMIPFLGIFFRHISKMNTVTLFLLVICFKIHVLNVIAIAKLVF